MSIVLKARIEELAARMSAIEDKFNLLNDKPADVGGIPDIPEAPKKKKAKKEST